jgi:hypothetical protein
VCVRETLAMLKHICEQQQQDRALDLPLREQGEGGLWDVLAVPPLWSRRNVHMYVLHTYDLKVKGASKGPTSGDDRECVPLQ